MAKLTNLLKTQTAGLEKRLVIAVDYNPHTYSVEIESITAEEQLCWKSHNDAVINYGAVIRTVDVTDLLLDNFDGFEEDVMTMDWEMIYNETKRRDVA